ncbi:hypothetical protein MRX96_029969 [Rhipicephalus microplus]
MSIATSISDVFCEKSKHGACCPRWTKRYHISLAQQMRLLDSQAVHEHPVPTRIVLGSPQTRRVACEDCTWTPRAKAQR